MPMENACNQHDKTVMYCWKSGSRFNQCIKLVVFFSICRCGSASMPIEFNNEGMDTMQTNMVRDGWVGHAGTRLTTIAYGFYGCIR